MFRVFVPIIALFVAACSQPVAETPQRDFNGPYLTLGDQPEQLDLLSVYTETHRVSARFDYDPTTRGCQQSITVYVLDTTLAVTTDQTLQVERRCDATLPDDYYQYETGLAADIESWVLPYILRSTKPQAETIADLLLQAAEG